MRAKSKNGRHGLVECAVEENRTSPEPGEPMDGTAEPDDEEVSVAANSIEASIGYRCLLRQLQHAYLETVAFYRSKRGGSLSIEEARAKAYHPCHDPSQAKELFDQLLSIPVDSISFASLADLWTLDPSAAQGLWEMIKIEAKFEFETGHLASKSLTPLDSMRTAWDVACYLGLRESLTADWKPRGGMELMLVDMLAQAFLQYQYWVGQSVLRAKTEPRQEPEEYIDWKAARRAERKGMGWEPGHWEIPYVREQDAVEHAIQMTDRWNRIYMRTLRNLRDLRRYQVPVTINNPQQVNVAAQGGKQVNISRSLGRKRRKR